MELNVLLNWYKQSKFLTSDFNIKQSEFHRKDVEFIYSQFLKAFGEEYFQNKLTYKKNWIFYALSAPENTGSHILLKTIAELLVYLEQLDPSINEEFNSLKLNDSNLRSFFYELLIYYQMDKKKIPNKKKIKLGNQVVEGICELDGKEYLFECKQSFIPNSSTLDFQCRLLISISQSIKKYIKFGQPFILCVDFESTLDGQAFNYLSHAIRELLRSELSKRSFARKRESKYGVSVDIMPFDIASFFEVSQLEKHKVCVYCKPPYEIVPGTNNFFHIELVTNFSVSNDSVYKKFENDYLKKIRQHKKSNNYRQLFFIDSEAFLNFNLGLFQIESAFDPKRIQRIHAEAKSDHLLCVTRRNYLRKDATISTNVCYRDPEDMSAANTIVELFSV